MSDTASYLKKHTEALVKDIGIDAACNASGKSKATLGRYYSTAEEHVDRFMPIDTVAALEQKANYPHVTSALAELRGITLSYDEHRKNDDDEGTVNSDVIHLSQRFGMLMAEYHQSITDGVITMNEAKRLLNETLTLQKILVEMKLSLEREVPD
ncbi:hypothetical protein [Parasulfitobacter algicola]|uniref:Uncharacterized protein n=1 Tax=Parasulfitobacter algicola TaxID=2614809 RepID=A0ABX2IT82_9RHOB|nr:hypothetical protein [Sulfitobacter algicola]NSX56118.1 hypothetical protein [Sulfitobacter algicola]